jgi:hypothetical protein
VASIRKNQQSRVKPAEIWYYFSEIVTTLLAIYLRQRAAGLLVSRKKTTRKWRRKSLKRLKTDSQKDATGSRSSGTDRLSAAVHGGPRRAETINPKSVRASAIFEAKTKDEKSDTKAHLSH